MMSGLARRWNGLTLGGELSVQSAYSACLGREHEAQQLTHIVDFRFPAWILAYDILIDILTGLSARSVLGVAAVEVEGRWEASVSIERCLWPRQRARYSDRRRCCLDHVWFICGRVCVAVGGWR